MRQNKNLGLNMVFFGGNLVKKASNATMNTTQLLMKARTHLREGNWASLNRALNALKLRRDRTGNAALSQVQLNQITNLNRRARLARRA